MSRNVYHRSTCRLCNSKHLQLVLPMPPSPIADSYISKMQMHEAQESYPLDLYLCGDCGHLQLCDVVAPDLLFRNYTYETSVSAGLVAHFKEYAAEVVKYASPSPGSLVVEIGSNDGSLLRFFKEHGFNVLGIDPARNIAQKASQSGIETLPEFFTKELALEIRNKRGPAAIMAANNVFAHADDLGGIADGIFELLAPDGIFVFEVAYLPDLIERKLIDTIYHEHLCYHLVKPLSTFFNLHNLELIDVLPIPSKGGSIRGIAQRLGGPRKTGSEVERLISDETEKQYDKAQTYEAFSSELQKMRSELLALLTRIKAEGKAIAGYGASATVTTFIYYFGVGAFLDYLLDDNPRKFDTFSPGLHLPVMSSKALYDRKPDYILITAWQYSDPIIRKHQPYLDAGGHFIVPLPSIRQI